MMGVWVFEMEGEVRAYLSRWRRRHPGAGGQGGVCAGPGLECPACFVQSHRKDGMGSRSLQGGVGAGGSAL